MSFHFNTLHGHTKLNNGSGSDAAPGSQLAHHTPGFDIDENCLPIASSLYVESALFLNDCLPGHDIVSLAGAEHSYPDEGGVSGVFQSPHNALEGSDDLGGRISGRT